MSFNRLKPAIEAKILGEVDRLSLIDDIFALVQAGKAETTDALELIKAFKTSETSYVVWSSIMNCLGKLRIIIAHDEDTDAKFQGTYIHIHILLINMKKKPLRFDGKYFDKQIYFKVLLWIS